MADTRAPLPLDPAALRRAFDRTAAAGAAAAFLDREIEKRMAERLEYIRHEPQRILDGGIGSGASLAPLRARFPKAALVGLDVSLERIRAVRPLALTERARQFFSGRTVRAVCGDLNLLPFAGGTFDLVWSNLALPFAADTLEAFREWHRVLRVGGLLMFSTYGPDTLKELREAFAAADAHLHVHGFIDMHDLGDMLVATGFAEPVMDMELLTLTYTDVGALASDLRRSGQINAIATRSRGLMTPRARDRMLTAYERFRRQDRLPATVEVIYGHAWKPAPQRAPDGRAILKFDRPGKRRGSARAP